MSRASWLSMLSVAALVIACAQPAPQPPAEPPPPSGERDAGSVAQEARVQAEAYRRERALTKHAPLMQPIAPAADVLGAGRYAPMQQNRENYAHFEDHGIQRAAEQPVSTFSIDVDTGAYSNLRRMLRAGQLPPEDAVRVEELINYFEYAYAPPKDRSTPFATHVEIAPTPWNAKTHLLRIGLQGWKPQGRLPPANLVFLVDVSGSMQSADKLPLVQSALKLLVQEMGAQDRISLVVYAGNTGVVLEPTAGDRKAQIAAAIERLQAGGSTNGAAGIELAYAMAQQGWIDGGINRVLLATDGDFNVGTVDFEQLKDLVEQRRKSGVALSTLGFGTGNYNDHLMEQLADAGNGNYSYIDSLEEAHRVLVQARAATLTTIAKDVKIQIEFNPAQVAEYRLIGYENRALAREDFANDRVDAGEIGAGHSVTALYEITLTGSGGERIAPLRYGDAPVVRGNGELAFLRLRYKAPDADASRLIERPIRRSEIRSDLAAASDDFRFAAAVAAFGQLLRGGRYTESLGFDDVLALARAARGDDAQGWRGELVQLVQLAQSLRAPLRQSQTGQGSDPICESGRGCS